MIFQMNANNNIMDLTTTPYTQSYSFPSTNPQFYDWSLSLAGF